MGHGAAWHGMAWQQSRRAWRQHAAAWHAMLKHQMTCGGMGSIGQDGAAVQDVLRHWSARDGKGGMGQHGCGMCSMLQHGAAWRTVCCIAGHGRPNAPIVAPIVPHMPVQCCNPNPLAHAGHHALTMRAWSRASSHPLVSFSIFLTCDERKVNRGQAGIVHAEKRIRVFGHDRHGDHGAHGGGCAPACRPWLPPQNTSAAGWQPAATVGARLPPANSQAHHHWQCHPAPTWSRRVGSSCAHTASWRNSPTAGKQSDSLAP